MRIWKIVSSCQKKKRQKSPLREKNVAQRIPSWHSQKWRLRTEVYVRSVVSEGLRKGSFKCFIHMRFEDAD